MSAISHLVPQAYLGLYRDDALIGLKASGRDLEHLKQQIEKVFKENNFNIDAQVDVKVINFLDVTLDLKSRSYQPYKKPIDQPVYVHVGSDHAPTHKKSIAEGVNKRISMLSSSEKIFNDNKAVYQEALNQAGHKYNMVYDASVGLEKKKKRKRQRDICYFNPPFTASVSTCVARMFLDLIDKHFPKGHPLHRFFNRNTVKVSYRSMRNIKAIVDSHNRRILNPPVAQKAGCG